MSSDGPSVEAVDAMAQRISRQRERIAQACARSGRSEADVTLVAVSKGHPFERLREAYEAGQRVFGENYVQEWRDKCAAAEAAEMDVAWHFIGHLQSNKARMVAPAAACVHTVDRAKLVAELDRHAVGPLPVLLEVNIGGEASKSGCAPEDVCALATRVAESEHLVPVGLMTVAPFFEDAEQTRPYFSRMRALLEDAQGALRGTTFETEMSQLSMGMSHDLEVAVEEGATLVRVGTAIFGARNYA